MKKFLIGYLFILSSQAFAYSNYAQSNASEAKPSVGMTPSHIVILQTDLEFIYGSYYFAVQNTTDTNQSFSSTIRLPQETIDFHVADGLNANEIDLRSDSSLGITKSYPPGLNLQGINFKIKIPKGNNTVLTFRPPENIPNFFIATPQSDALQFQAPGFEPGIPPMLQGGQYTGIKGMQIEAGQELKIVITSLLGGTRVLLTYVAIITALLLALGAFLLAKRTYARPEETPL